MLTYRLRHSVALVLMGTQLVGCHHWVASPDGVGTLAQDSVPKLRLTIRDEFRRVTVMQPAVVGDSIYGVYLGGAGAMALEDVSIVEVWELDKGKTAIGVLGFLLLTATITATVALVVVACSDEPPNPIYNFCF